MAPTTRKNKRGANPSSHKDKSEANPEFKSGVTWQSGGKKYKGIVLSGSEAGMYAVGIVSPHVGPGECIVHVKASDLKPAAVFAGMKKE